MFLYLKRSTNACVSKKTHPNFKVDECFKYFNKVSLEAYNPGEFIATDDQDQIFSGKGNVVVRHKFKKEGDRYFMDSVCERGTH